VDVVREAYGEGLLVSVMRDIYGHQRRSIVDEGGGGDAIGENHNSVTVGSGIAYVMRERTADASPDCCTDSGGIRPSGSRVVALIRKSNRRLSRQRGEELEIATDQVR
jgi:hypothetical protein